MKKSKLYWKNVYPLIHCWNWWEQSGMSQWNRCEERRFTVGKRVTGPGWFTQDDDSLSFLALLCPLTLATDPCRLAFQLSCTASCWVPKLGDTNKRLESRSKGEAWYCRHCVGQQFWQWLHLPWLYFPPSRADLLQLVLTQWPWYMTSPLVSGIASYWSFFGLPPSSTWIFRSSITCITNSMD